MDKIEIPFGAYDSETLGWTYTIPKGYTAKIEDGKIIVKKEESEDERIRNGLLHHFKNKMKPYWNELAVKDIVAYLEKQKPENVSATTMAPSCWEVEQKEQKPLIAGNDFGWIDELKHDLEHPEELDEKVDDVLKQRKGIRALEWSEEDESQLDDIEKAISITYDLNHAPQYHYWLEQKLKSLRSQSKQEWSEEDEDKLEECIRIVSGWERDYDIVKSPYSNFLKSLRPPKNWKEGWCEDCKVRYNRWKPSEEQMEAYHAILLNNTMYYTKTQEELFISLYNDLKKLM